MILVCIKLLELYQNWLVSHIILFYIIYCIVNSGFDSEPTFLYENIFRFGSLWDISKILTGVYMITPNIILTWSLCEYFFRKNS